VKDFSANWFGTADPVVSTAASTEPGYAAQIPVAHGGPATAPGGQPDILGAASANFDYTPLLTSGTDTAAGTAGFQGDHAKLRVTALGSQAGTTGRIQEGIDRAGTGGTVNVLAGTFAENVTVNKRVDLTGAGDTTIVDPSVAGPAIAITAAETAVTARAKKGTTFVYSLSEPSRVVFTIEKRTSGRTVGGKCVRSTRSNRSRRSCVLYVTVGSFAQDGVTASNRKAFSGKIGTKSLAPARYRATLVARDAAGNESGARRLNLTVVRR
jgi:hypothetical protein